MMTRPTALLVLGMTLFACARSEDSATTDSASELRAATDFFCARADHDDAEADLSMRFENGGTNLSVEWGLDNIVTGDGAVDPFSADAASVRFDGFIGLTRPPRTTAVAILVSRSMLEGEAGRVALRLLDSVGRIDERPYACQPTH